MQDPVGCGSFYDDSYWYSCPCSTACLWVWAGTSYSFLANRICGTWHRVSLPRLSNQTTTTTTNSGFRLAHPLLFVRRKVTNTLWVDLWRQAHGKGGRWPTTSEDWMLLSFSGVNVEAFTLFVEPSDETTAPTTFSLQPHERPWDSTWIVAFVRDPKPEDPAKLHPDTWLTETVR